MTISGNLEIVDVNKIVIDTTNPRIQKFLEMYGDDPTPEQIYMALGAGSEDPKESFEKLKNSIFTSGGIIQPIIVNRKADGTIVCIEGNTRVAIYLDFLENDWEGNWQKIQAIVHENANQITIDAIRLQAHLVGPRQWDPYSKAKYLHHLRNHERMPFSAIVDYCGGRQKEVTESIQAFEEMEKYYHEAVPDTDFETKRFSGFVELQKAGVKEAIYEAGFKLSDFAVWNHEGKFERQEYVRSLPKILRDPKAKKTFLMYGAREAIKHLDRPDLEKTLGEASLGQLARALRQRIDMLPYHEHERLRANPEDDTVQYILEVLYALQGLADSLDLLE